MGLTDIVNEAHLTLLDGGVGAVAHGRNLQPLRPLLVSLLEELLHQQAAPLLIEMKSLCRIGQVGAVEHVLQHLNPLGVVVQEEHPTSGHLLRLDHRLQVRQQTHVLAHVRRKHHVDGHPPQRLPLLLAQVDEDVAVRVLEHLEGHRQRVRLQHRLVVVHERQL